MNEPNNRVDGSPNDSLTDLQVNPEQAEEERAGTLGSGGGGRAGKVHVADFSVTTSIRRSHLRQGSPDKAQVRASGAVSP